MHEVIAVFGPTGVGKTDVVLELAARLRERGERPIAVSADALQVYNGLSTLTGAAAPAQQELLEHKLVGFVPATRDFSVGEYMPLAHAAIDDALAAGRQPIVVGGTGLYLRAALAELSLPPAPPRALRARLEAELARRGPAALHGELLVRDPELAGTIDPSDSTRVVRTLELLEQGIRERRRSELWEATYRHPTRLFALIRDREELYRMIDARVERMVAEGAADEVRRAADAGASRTARKALGFEELLSGDIEAMKRRTRNYAKRQLTWMRKLPGVTTIDLSNRTPAAAAREIEHGVL